MGLTRPRAHQLQDIDYKQTARAVTTSNVTLSGGAPATVDGVSLALRDRVLVTAQTTGSENGIYYVTTVGAGSNGTWARSLDADATGEIKAGTIIMITEGTTYADTQWKLTTDDPITVGSTTMTFVRAGNAAYGTIAVSGQNSIVADQIGDTLTMVAGTNLALTTNDGTDTLTITPSLTPSLSSVTISGNATANNISVTNFVNSNLIPVANATYNLGSATNQWNEVHIAGSTLYLGDLQLKDSGGNTFTVFGSDGTTPAEVTGNIAGANVTGTVANATYADSSGTAATVTTAAQPNITSVGTLTSVSVTGNVSAGNVVATIVGDVTGDVTGNVSGTAATVTTAAQPNITSVGTLTSVTTSGNISTDGIININDRQGLYLHDSDSSHYVALVPPATVTGNVTFVLPGDSGTADYVLATNGAGTLSWVEQSGGGSSGASSFPNSTVTPLPSSEGNFDLSYNYAQTTQETPFESGGTDAFGVSLGEVYSMMDPAGDIPDATDLGVLT